MLNLVAGVLLMVVTRTHGFACISNNLNSFQGSSSSAQTAAAVSPMPTPSLNLEATWSRTKSTAQRGRCILMLLNYGLDQIEKEDMPVVFFVVTQGGQPCDVAYVCSITSSISTSGTDK